MLAFLQLGGDELSGLVKRLNEVTAVEFNRSKAPPITGPMPKLVTYINVLESQITQQLFHVLEVVVARNVLDDPSPWLFQLLRRVFGSSRPANPKLANSSSD